MEKTVGMRGEPDPQLAMLTSLSTEDLIPADHPIRKIRVVVDTVLGELDEVFDGMYATGGRASVPPETLLKSTVLMAMYSIRSERAFCERLNYDLLFMAEGVGLCQARLAVGESVVGARWGMSGRGRWIDCRTTCDLWGPRRVCAGCRSWLRPDDRPSWGMVCFGTRSGGRNQVDDHASSAGGQNNSRARSLPAIVGVHAASR